MSNKEDEMATWRQISSKLQLFLWVFQRFLRQYSYMFPVFTALLTKDDCILIIQFVHICEIVFKQFITVIPPNTHTHKAFSSFSHAISYRLIICVRRWISQLVPESLRVLLIRKRIVFIALRLNGPLARYVKLRVVHAPGMTGTFPIPTCITARAWRTCRYVYQDR